MQRLIYPALVFLAMAGWGVFHSWLASFSAKRLARKVFGTKIDRYYRLLFVATAVITLLPVLAMVVLLPSRMLWTIPTPWIFLTLVLQFLALVALVATTLQTDVMAFAGVRQVLQPGREHENVLVTTGLYRTVRHPLYLFSIILFWLSPYMTDLTFAFFLAGTLYFVIGTIPEERKLVQTFGEQYRQYRREVPWLIPGLKFRRK
jgi:protein-S-isoprenylcysteine O-methyltransferase Ste14